jgi:HSP20 family molecular chaperone IbpA
MRRTEIHYGHFYRRVPVPEDANVDQANAKLDSGVLEITLPVPQHENQRRQIPIQKAAGLPLVLRSRAELAVVQPCE